MIWDKAASSRAAHTAPLPCGAAGGVFLMLFVLCIALVSCDYGAEDLFGRADDVSSRASSLYEVPSPISASALQGGAPYTVAVITDVHFARDARGGKSHDVPIERFTSWLNGMPSQDRPLFIICLGDVSEYGKESGTKEYAAWMRELQGIANRDGTIKVFNAIGNHDLYNGGYDAWKRLIFPHTFYHFDAGMLSWYFIDTASGAVGRKQYNALEDAFCNDAKPKVVLSHFPLYASGKFYFCMQNTTERNMLLSLFARKKVRYVFTGHTHESCTDDFGKFTEHNIPSLLDKEKWAVLTVDGASISVEIMG